ncbi:MULTISPECIES: hypothetical protein [unclassified Haladaptatus]|nr:MULTISPECIES: hypothetical protein [unclassified Haladaptatus]
MATTSSRFSGGAVTKRGHRDEELFEWSHERVGRVRVGRQQFDYP